MSPSLLTRLLDPNWKRRAELERKREELDLLESERELEQRARALSGGAALDESEAAAPPVASGPTRDEILNARAADIEDGGRGGEKAIGSRLGLSEASVQRWRKHHGLIPWPEE